ncbi:MAG: SAM-dependent DNA methyltransferase [Alphaproteobacteria bacterium]|nr:SAM-dependent DNA methyltransferase [Alphaproteobacteria bacterium]
MAALRKASERRAEHLLNDLLQSQGWDVQRDVLFQQEYRRFPELAELLANASKTGTGYGVPEAILIDRRSGTPLAVIEAKASASKIDLAIAEAQSYAKQLFIDTWHPLAIGIAGTSDDEFALRVAKYTGRVWKTVSYESKPINWIPTRDDLVRVAIPSASAELRPTIPPPEVLASRADEMNRLLREAHIKDEFRPAVVAAIMLALWWSEGAINRDPRFILGDVNRACMEAFVKAGKRDLAKSLRVDEANDKLKNKARRIARILERLNVTVLTAEHDYLGQLYETFFRYTGGNTIGQYFTPRHITKFMADACEVSPKDTVIDPACGTGGFLVACMERIWREHGLSRAQMVQVVKRKLIGFEEEPITAALCVANMILRGDGSTGVHRGDCFSEGDFPIGKANIALMNPPFPHKKTDTPIEDFVDRALDSLQDKGVLAVILPMSLLVKKDKAEWRARTLKRNSLLSVCQLPDELFQPFAAATTSFVLLEKGGPHNKSRKTSFIRLQRDGFALRKGARVEWPSGGNQIPQALDAILNHATSPGFAKGANVYGGDEWAPGAYIESASYDEEQLKLDIDVLLRRLASFYTRYASEIIEQRKAISAGSIVMQPYRKMISKARLNNRAGISEAEGTVGGLFDIFYGMKELHSREGLSPGRSLIVSPTEEYNGCYGWLDFPRVLEPAFVTVAQTGSIGEAFVQLEPAAVNDDCLVLLPKPGKRLTEADLVIVAACLHEERWRFSYGRKLTPSRISGFTVPLSEPLRRWVKKRLGISREVIEASLAPYGGAAHPLEALKLG